MFQKFPAPLNIYGIHQLLYNISQVKLMIYLLVIYHFLIHIIYALRIFIVENKLHVHKL
jgi:hypothetical protein